MRCEKDLLFWATTMVIAILVCLNAVAQIMLGSNLCFTLFVWAFGGATLSTIFGKWIESED